jgi:transposase-like protein
MPTTPLPTDLPRPKNLLEFVRLFPTDDACAEYLFQVRWSEGFVCPKCGDTHAYEVKGKPGMVQCKNHHKTSVTAGTVMHRTRQPLTTWFYAAYLVSTLTPGISALQFQKQLGIKRYETAFQMLHKLRSAMVAPERDKLSGEVEVDEAFIGGVEPGKSGREPGKKALVVVAVEIVRYKSKKRGGHVEQHDADGPPERGATEGPVERKRAGRVRMTVIPNAGAETLLPWVESNIEKGSTVYTDGWQGYRGLEALGYQHERVLQSHKGVKTGRWLPLVHLMISNLKRWLVGTHKGAVRSQHLQAYLNEFTFRFNRRFWRGPAFIRALGLATRAESWPEYATLYGTKKGDGWRHPNPDTDSMLWATVREQLLASGQDDTVIWMEENRDELIRVVREMRREEQSGGQDA